MPRTSPVLALFSVLFLLTSCNASHTSSEGSSVTALDSILSAKSAKKPALRATGKPEDDKKNCTAQFKVKSEQYYQCRARLIRERLSNASVLKKLTPGQREHQATLEQQAVEFESKAKKSHKKQAGSVRSARNDWEQAQAEKINKVEAADHQACTKKGFSRGKMEHPDTEAYFDCRAVLAAKRASPPPADAGYDPKQLPKAVLEFYRQAEEAEQAFNARDYQDHYACVNQNLFPGPWEEPNTADYYRCRATLARDGLGKDVEAIFLEDVAHAKKEAEEHQACTLRGYQKSTKEYGLCRKAYIAYKSCKNGIRSKVSTKEAGDRRDCNQKSTLEYPARLAKKDVQEITNVTEDGSETKMKSVKSGRFTRKELSAVRASSTNMCLNGKEVDRVQYRLQLDYQCDQIMNNIAEFVR